LRVIDLTRQASTSVFYDQVGKTTLLSTIFRFSYFLSFITTGAQRVTNSPFFTGCPTIIGSNKKVLKRKQIRP